MPPKSCKLDIDSRHSDIENQDLYAATQQMGIVSSLVNIIIIIIIILFIVVLLMCLLMHVLPGKQIKLKIRSVKNILLK